MASSCIAKNPPVQNDTDVKVFLDTLSSMDSDMGLVLHDISDLQKKKCGYDTSVQELRAIATDNNTFAQILANKSNDSEYLFSIDYGNALIKEFGVCHKK